MTVEAQGLILTDSQAGCLIALRRGKGFQPEIAIEAKLDLRKTAAALQALARLGLAKQGRNKKWHATARDKTYRFKTVPGRTRRNAGLLGPAGSRLLELLDRPMRGNEIVEKLGVRRLERFQRTGRLTDNLQLTKSDFLVGVVGIVGDYVHACGSGGSCERSRT